MTYRELISYDKGRVRGSSDLTFYFKKAYKNIFGFEPSCTSCAISNEFKNLVEKIRNSSFLDDDITNEQTPIIMENNNKTFTLSSQGQTEDMLAYVDENKVLRRKFVTLLTDGFVIGYLTNGTEEEITERKKLFKILPLQLREEPKKEEVILKTKPKKNK